MPLIKILQYNKPLSNAHGNTHLDTLYSLKTRKNTLLHISTNSTCIASPPSSSPKSKTQPPNISYPRKNSKIKFKSSPKLIKEALQQVKILFPPAPQEQKHALNIYSDNQHVGKQIPLIVGTKFTSHKDKQGAQAINLCQCNINPNHLQMGTRIPTFAHKQHRLRPQPILTS